MEVDHHVFKGIRQQSKFLMCQCAIQGIPEQILTANHHEPQGSGTHDLAIEYIMFPSVAESHKLLHIRVRVGTKALPEKCAQSRL